MLDRYATEHGIEVEGAEVDTYVVKLRRDMAAEGLTGEDDLTPDERLELDSKRRQMGYAIIRQWKINKSLHESYGGRVIYQQLGPEPLDAYREYFEQRQSAGDFTIKDPRMAESFWGYFNSEDLHDFMEPGGEDEARAFSSPSWLD